MKLQMEEFMYRNSTEETKREEVIETIQRNLEVLKHSKGAKYVLFLMKNIRQAFPYFYIENYFEGDKMDYPEENEDKRVIHSTSNYFMSSPIPMCDKRTKEEIQKRLKVINQILEEKNIENVIEMKNLEEEKEQLIIYLSEVLTTAGRIRAFKEELRKPKKAVLQNIDRFLEEFLLINAEITEYIIKRLEKRKYTISFFDWF